MYDNKFYSHLGHIIARKWYRKSMLHEMAGFVTLGPPAHATHHELGGREGDEEGTGTSGRHTL